MFVCIILSQCTHVFVYVYTCVFVCICVYLCVFMCMRVCNLDLKVVVYVREEDHLLFVPGLCVVGFDPPSDPPSLAAQTHHHLVM